MKSYPVSARMNEYIKCFAFLPNDSGILGALEDMKILNFQDGKIHPVTSTTQMAYCESVAISPDGNRVVAGTGRCFKVKGIPPDANRVRIWDLRNGRLLHDLQEHRQWVWAVAYSPDGKYILSGGGGCDEDFWGYRADSDHAIRLWDAENGKLLYKVDCIQAAVLSLAFSRDGKYALSGSADGTIYVWQMQAGISSPSATLSLSQPETTAQREIVIEALDPR